MTLLATINQRPLATVRSTPPTASYWGRWCLVVILGCWSAGLVFGLQTALGVLTLWSFAAAVIGIWRPVLGLLGIGMLCTLEPLMQSFVFTGGLWRWHTLDYWLLLVAIGFGPLLLGLTDARNRLAQTFAALLAAEVLVSPDWYQGLQDMAGVAALFGLVVYCVRVGKDVDAWRWLGLVCGTTAAAWGIEFFVQQASLPIINYNAWAVLPLTALFAICLAFPLARRWSHGQVILAMLASVNLTLVFLSGSRGTLLTATGCGLFLLVLTPLRRRLLVVLTAALVAFALTTQFTDLQARAVGRLNLLWDPERTLINRTSGRSDLIVSGWHLFLGHPFGVGTGGFGIARVSSLGMESQWARNSQMAAHAGWIKILAENGVPGVALMGAYALSFIIAGWRSRNRDLLMLGLLVPLAFGLGFVSTEYQSKALWFLAAGVMVFLRPGSVLTQNAARSA